MLVSTADQSCTSTQIYQATLKRGLSLLSVTLWQHLSMYTFTAFPLRLSQNCPYAKDNSKGKKLLFLYNLKVTRDSAFVPFSNILYVTYCKASSNPICPHSSLELSHPELPYALWSYFLAYLWWSSVWTLCKNHGLFYLVWLWVCYCSQHRRSLGGKKVNERKGRQVHLIINSILSRQWSLFHTILSLRLASKTL